MQTDNNIMEAMSKAIANYTGPVTRCPPGNARSKAAPVPIKADQSSRWLKRHRNERRITDPKGRRRRLRIARAQRERIAKRNAAVRKQRNIRERL
jgi:hypothetical protein